MGWAALLLLLPGAASLGAPRTRVTVEVRRALAVPPAAARRAWLDYTWATGGGLPVFVTREAGGRARTVWPAGLREVLDDPDDDGAARYRVSDVGPILAAGGVVAGTHRGEVAFAAAAGSGCELAWTVRFDAARFAPAWRAATAALVGAAADGLARRVAASASENSSPRWFDPLAEFALDEARPDPARLPLLLILPGLDGSAVTAWAQYPDLGRDYELRCLEIPPGDRSSWASLVAVVAGEVDRAAAARRVFVLGESMGAGLALAVGADRADRVAGLVLVSPATAWHETALGGARDALAALPAPLLAAVVALSGYQLFDGAQVATTLRRVATGERAPSLAGASREAYAWRVVRDLPRRLAAPAETIRHRLAWMAPTYAAAAPAALNALRSPLLLVAGTADLRTPAAAEATRIARDAPTRATVKLVEGAGHAGATDDRLDLRAAMADAFP